jgi:branched-chain amino acid transport system permease protein
VTGRVVGLHATVLAVLFALQFALPAFHHGMIARVMVLSTYAIGYNLLLGYTGLMSLGHAVFFAAGMYGTGLTIHHWGFGVATASLAGIAAALLAALVAGVVTRRTGGAAFLIVTLMLAQAFYLATLHFREITLGDDGFIVSAELVIGGRRLVLTDPTVKYNVAFAVFALCLLGTVWLVRSPVGRVLIGLRENEERTRLLGYDTHRYRLIAVVLSGVTAGLAGVTYTLLFSYVGSTFAGVQHSIDPLLATLLGGAGTTLGPLVGTLLMTYVVDLAKGFTVAYLVVVGVALVVVVLWAPAGVVGGIRARWARWLP